MSSPRLTELELRKEILRLKAETHRLEIEQEVDRLGHGLRGLASGLNAVRLLHKHPLAVSAAGALVTRLGPSRLLKLAAVAAAAWFAFRVAQASRARKGP